MLEVGALVAAACERAGYDDFGEDTWREGLEVLVAAASTEASLNEIGEQVLADQLVDNLVNRLEIERWYARHPEIEQQEIVAPLFGLGLPRTGSTALSSLLACDPARRSLRMWEATQPCPPPQTASEDTDPRIARAAAGIEVTNQLFPDFVGMLPSSPTGPQECIVVMGFDFRSMIFQGSVLTPSYTKWLLACDMEPAYRYHRRVLKLLQWRCPPTRWWLKSPAHLASIEALDAVYPDARFVMTHREIPSVLLSVCALKRALMRPVTTHQDLVTLGTHETELWSEALRRTIAFRDAGREDRFFDVGFDELQTDPIGAVERLYDDLGDELGPEARERMTTWWADNSTHRSASARAAPEDFGLDLAALGERFAFYHDRFDIAVRRRG